MNSFGIYHCDSVADVYYKVYNDMLEAPEIEVRSNKTKELVCPQILITNPRARIAYHKVRGWNLAYALAESMLLFMKKNHVEYFSTLNSKMKDFAEDDVLYGAYGYRIAEYIPSIIKKLRDDESTRQAAMTILKAEDANVKTKDLPCTMSLQLIIRENKLNMVTSMRSNDIIWGFQYDVFMFTTMQEIIANELDIKIGWYLHRPTSLHVYDYHYDLFEKVANKFESFSTYYDYNYEEWMELCRLYENTIENGSMIETDYNEINIIRAKIKKNNLPGWVKKFV